jgi:hypothetical protein
MIPQIFLYFIVAAFAKAVMDVHAFRWEQSPFARLDRCSLLYWWCRKESWKNKHEMAGNSRLLKRLFSGPFVWITDVWHFAQFVMLTCFQFCIILFVPLPGLISPAVDWFIWLLILKAVFGAPFDLFFTFLSKTNEQSS